jgi:hypothetical protein
VYALNPFSKEGFALYSSALGISSCLLGDTAVNDLESARSWSYYREISSGASVQAAFKRGQDRLDGPRKHIRLFHPALSQWNLARESPFF